jgi:hypothetical protein
MTILGQTRRCHFLGAGINQNKVWGDTQFLTEFIPDVTAIPPVIATKVVSAVKSHKRRRYPGDVGFTVASTSRERLNKVPAKGGGSLPGRNFSMALADDDGAPIAGTRHQFTYQGSFADLKVNIEALAGFDLIIYSTTGRPHLIAAS